jgi:hypothetical protein
MQNTALPVLDEREKGQIALMLITDEMVLSRNWLEKPNNTRRELISKAKGLNIEPNKLLSLLHELTQPNLDALFKPITSEEVTAYEKDREERRKARQTQ